MPGLTLKGHKSQASTFHTGTGSAVSCFAALKQWSEIKRHMNLPWIYLVPWWNQTTLLHEYFMENAMNSYQKAWISTYQEGVNRISGINSWYEIMVFFMNWCFCVWIHIYQEGVKAISSHEIIPWNHGMNSLCSMISLYEFMVHDYSYHNQFIATVICSHSNMNS